MNRNWLWLGAGVVALAFLGGSALGVGASTILWVLFLLACPLMHFLGFHGHGGSGGGGHAHGGGGPVERDTAPRALKGPDEA